MSDTGHRGGFGEFGGESSGLIDRTFRERIVLVGVTGPLLRRPAGKAGKSGGKAPRAA